MSEYSFFLLYYHIFINEHSRNTFSDRHFFLGIEANVLLRLFNYNAQGAIFEPLYTEDEPYKPRNIQS